MPSTPALSPAPAGVLARTSLKARFALLGAVALALIGVPTGLYVNESLKALAVEQQEMAGLPPARALLELLQMVQQHRGLSAGVLGGNAALAAQREAKQREVEALLVKADAIVPGAAVAPALAAAYAKAQKDWKQLSSSVAARSISVPDSYTAHTQLAADMIGVIELVADHSGITLDPAADGYFIATTSLLHLPALAEALGMGRAKGAGLLATGQASPADRVYMASLRDRITDRLKRVQSSLDKAIEAHPPMGAPLAEPMQRASRQATAMLQLIDDKVIRADKLTEPSGTWIAQFTQAIDTQFALVDASLKEFELVLQGRHSRVVGELTVLGALIGLLTIAGGLFGWWLLRGVTRGLSAAGAIADAIAAGKLDNRIDAGGADETGRLLAALQKMQDRLTHSVANFEGQIAAIGKAQAVIEFSLDGTILAANDNFCATVGYALGEIEGKHHSMFVEASHAGSAEYRQFWDKLERGEFDSGQYKRVGKGGREIWIQASYNPILDVSGKPFKVVEYASDVTAAVRASLDMTTTVEQTQALVAAAVQGDLAQRLDLAGKSGALKQLAEGINSLMDTTSEGVEEVVRILGAMARADLSARIDKEFHGSFARMKDDANATAENLTQTVRKITEASETIKTAASEIASGNTDLSQRTEEQASSLEETAASMEQLTSTVKQNADNARQANQLAVTASEVALKGGSVVSQVVTTMSSITESSKKIVDIISVIDGIAFQTNILALNAAVEAARAGEQGRGFAVVASEVRNLAQRSAAAAKEIKALIGDSVEKVDTGSKLVESAGKTMEDIVMSVKRVTDIMGEISAASAEQSSGIEQVNSAITQMDKVTQQNAALVEQAAAASASMQEQAGNLSQLVGSFTLSSAAAGGAEWDGAERRGPNRAANVSRIAAGKGGKRAAPQARQATGTDGDDDDWEQF